MSAVDFETFVNRLATISGEAIMPFFRTAIAAEDKAHGGAFDPVTEADRSAELVMRQMIKNTFPEHGVIGEEFGVDNPEAEYVWVIDPIDGTKSFICGFPTWGTLIGLMHHGRPCYGMMHQPFSRERFFGDGATAFWRGPAKTVVAGQGQIEEKRRLSTRACPTLAQATLMTTSPALIAPHRLADFQRIERQVRLSRYGGDCYAYCALAAGHVDLVIETGLKPYDIVALIPIIEGSGGVITTWEGGNPASGGEIIASGDPALHRIALDLLAG
jgi:myo-inositol-1(or 4)-monophosphatase